MRRKKKKMEREIGKNGEHEIEHVLLAIDAFSGSSAVALLSFLF